MRKRVISAKIRKTDDEMEETATQICTSACQSLLDSLTVADQQITARLAVCATKEAPFGHLRPVMKVLEISCHGVPWILGSLLLFSLSHKPQDIVVAVNLLGALLFDIVVVCILKLMFRRTRPSHNVMDMFAAPSVDKFSFPSGHSTRAAMMGWFLCAHFFSTRQLCCFLVCLWSIGVSSSRILLGRHHVFDVICGFLIGLAAYHVYMIYIWISQETCLGYLDTYFGHFHL
ncbi:presqualene diphosphate phosphatase-like [Plakobranchus ocellatus]|uniref:Presqualene diphosphate phosphatase-like n=1 Tax=Plakobranchus ocellatus TaxID=259542 RepID=A0AAV3Y3E5_9GAST|nr:presqualene diphosphate phosphatase-like [Plakobranchus ocellatus]